MYTVKKVDRNVVDADWSKECWRDVKPILLNKFLGFYPKFFPKTQAKLSYDDKNIYVIFHVEDQYVRAQESGFHGRVWEDSCVEFFFTPSQNPAQGYFNLEMNCMGSFLLNHQFGFEDRTRKIAIEDCEVIEVATSIKEPFIGEIAEPLDWTVEYRLPIAILKKYAAVEQPRSGAKWRVNLYKCADKSSHPHWLMAFPIDLERPTFHQCENFTEIVFE